MSSLHIVALIIMATCAMRSIGWCAPPVKHKLGTGDRQFVWKVAFSGDGKLLAVACGDIGERSEIRLYSVATRELISKLPGHDKEISGLHFTADGKLLVSTGMDNRCLIWDIEARKLLGKLNGHSEGIMALSVSRDGTKVATASLDKSVIIWDLRQQKQLYKLEGHKSKVIAADFSPNGEYLVSAGHDNVVRIWTAKTGKEAFNFKAHPDGVNCLAFTPDGAKIVTGGEDGQIILWEVLWDLRKANDLATWRLGRNQPISFAMNPNGTQIAAGTWSGEVVLISLKEDAVISQLTINAHKFPVPAVAFSPNAKRLATGSGLESIVWLWEDLPQ